MIRVFCVAISLLVMTQAFGVASPYTVKECPLRLVVELKETIDDGQTITMLKVSGSFFKTDDQQPFRFDGSSAELFADLDKQAKRKRIIQKIAIGSAITLLAGSIAVFGSNERMAKRIAEGGKEMVRGSDEYKKYIRRSKIMAALAVSSIIAGISAPFAGDHGWQKHRDELEELFANGKLTTSDQTIVKVLEHYLDATNDFEQLSNICLLRKGRDSAVGHDVPPELKFFDQSFFSKKIVGGVGDETPDIKYEF